MSDKVRFNIIEENKTNNVEDIEKAINIIINRLIEKQFLNLQQ